MLIPSSVLHSLLLGWHLVKKKISNLLGGQLGGRRHLLFLLTRGPEWVLLWCGSQGPGRQAGSHCPVAGLVPSLGFALGPRCCWLQTWLCLPFRRFLPGLSWSASPLGTCWPSVFQEKGTEAGPQAHIFYLIYLHPTLNACLRVCDLPTVLWDAECWHKSFCHLLSRSSPLGGGRRKAGHLWPQVFVLLFFLLLFMCLPALWTLLFWGKLPFPSPRDFMAKP